MTAEFNLEKEIHVRGKALLKEIVSLLSLKGMSDVVPYKITLDNLYIDFANGILTVQGRNDAVSYLNIFVSGENFECLAKNCKVKPLTASRSKAIKEKVQAVIGAFSFYNVKVQRFSLELHGSDVAIVSDTSQGRHSMVARG